VDFYLKLPVEEFIALNNEVAEGMAQNKTLELSIKIAGKVDKKPDDGDQPDQYPDGGA